MRKIITGLLIGSVSLSIGATTLIQQKNAFINQMVSRDHFSRAQMQALFSALKPDQRVIRSMNSPYEKKPWTFYRHFFITRQRIDLGAQYLKTHHAVLMDMQRRYGIPASIITAIIGVETEYGLHLGKYSVLKSLYTLGFYYPPREKFFRSELAQYLVLTRDNHLNKWAIKGSYAGALGIPQFMPSSYRYYGVAFRKGEPVNLFNNNDAIASVANYFHKNGWAPNQPITHLTNQKQGKDIIALPFYHHMQYWKTYKNFNVIMTYNHNIVYAMAVYQLSQAIQKQYAKERSAITASSGKIRAS